MPSKTKPLVEKAHRTEHSPSDAATRKIGTVGVAHSPDGGYGWIIVLSSFLLNFVVDGVIYTVGNTLIKSWVVQYGSNETSAAFAMSILTAVYYLVGPIASAFSNVFGCRKVVIAGGIISALGFMLTTVAPNIYVVYLTFGIIAGTGFGFVYISSLLVLPQYFNKKRSLATGMAVCGSGIGTTVLSYVNTYVFAKVENDWRRFMYFIAVLSFSIVPIALLLKKNKNKQQINTLERLEDEVPTTQLVQNKELAAGDLPVVKLVDETENATLLDPVVQEELERPLARLDAFYNQSIDNEQMKHRAQNLTHDPTAEAVEIVNLKFDAQGKAVKPNVWEAVKSSLNQLLDKSLLTSLSYIILAVSGLLTTLAFYVPFLYLVNVMEKIEGLTDSQKQLPIALVGFFNIAARLFLGWFCSLSWVSPMVVSYVFIIFGGISVMAVPLFTAYWQFVAFSAPFAVGVACFAALRSVICLDFVGLARHPPAFGILLSFMGIGAFVGSPIAALIKDITGNFDTSFYVMGAVMIISGFMLIPLQAMRQNEERRATKNVAFTRIAGGADSGKKSEGVTLEETRLTDSPSSEDNL